MDRREQGCQIFLGPNIPKREKYNKWPQTIPNGHKVYQMAMKYSKWSYNIPTFTFQSPSKIYPNLGFWVLKQTIWQPWPGVPRCRKSLGKVRPLRWAPDHQSEAEDVANILPQNYAKKNNFQRSMYFFHSWQSTHTYPSQQKAWMGAFRLFQLSKCVIAAATSFNVSWSESGEGRGVQGCQIFLGTTYQNEKIYTKCST
jgi:hypothetical protein